MQYHIFCIHFLGQTQARSHLQCRKAARSALPWPPKNAKMTTYDHGNGCVWTCKEKNEQHRTIPSFIIMFPIRSVKLGAIYMVVFPASDHDRPKWASQLISVRPFAIQKCVGSGWNIHSSWSKHGARHTISCSNINCKMIRISVISKSPCVKSVAKQIQNPHNGIIKDTMN